MTFLETKWCVVVAVAAGLVSLGLAVGLRGPLRHPADPEGFQARIKAWQLLDEQWTPAQRATGPKRARER